eukprot:Gb_32929 [translate_table: standard]
MWMMAVSSKVLNLAGSFEPQQFPKVGNLDKKLDYCHSDKSERFSIGRALKMHTHTYGIVCRCLQYILPQKYIGLASESLYLIVQRHLKLRIEAQGRYLEKIIEEHQTGVTKGQVASSPESSSHLSEEHDGTTNVVLPESEDQGNGDIQHATHGQEEIIGTITTDISPKDQHANNTPWSNEKQQKNLSFSYEGYDGMPYYGNPEFGPLLKRPRVNDVVGKVQQESLPGKLQDQQQMLSNSYQKQPPHLRFGELFSSNCQSRLTCSVGQIESPRSVHFTTEFHPQHSEGERYAEEVYQKHSAAKVPDPLGFMPLESHTQFSTYLQSLNTPSVAELSSAFHSIAGNQNVPSLQAGLFQPWMYMGDARHDFYFSDFTQITEIFKASDCTWPLTDNLMMITFILVPIEHVIKGHLYGDMMQSCQTKHCSLPTEHVIKDGPGYFDLVLHGSPVGLAIGSLQDRLDLLYYSAIALDTLRVCTWR